MPPVVTTVTLTPSAVVSTGTPEAGIVICVPAEFALKPLAAWEPKSTAAMSAVSTKPDPLMVTAVVLAEPAAVKSGLTSLTLGVTPEAATTVVG